MKKQETRGQKCVFCVDKEHIDGALVLLGKDFIGIPELVEEVRGVDCVLRAAEGYDSEGLHGIILRPLLLLSRSRTRRP